jgi:UDP:flavonoid glycosyltransferase YjiC (YdhE family)
MAKILMAWELGGGLGHLIQLLPLVQGLEQRGHRVMAVLKDLSRARAILGPTVSLMQAPVKTRKIERAIVPPMTFAHILHNVGFADEQELAAMTHAWRHIYAYARPDVIVFDHSPTALLAARGLPPRRVLIGSGFFTPPDVYPLPVLRPWLKPDLPKLRADEDQLLSRINQILQSHKTRPLDRLSRLYSDVHENFLTTFPELDHYPRRQGAHYWGFWTTAQGKSPQWPDGREKKIYAYLKPFSALPDLLKGLNELGHATLVSVDGIDEKLQARLASPTLRFENERLDLSQVARECDLAIMNANHGSTIYMLMAGKPTLQIPLTLEQGLFGRAVRRMGAGLDASGRNPAQLMDKLQTILSSDHYAEAARRFAATHAGFDAVAQTQRMVNRIEELAAPR